MMFLPIILICHMGQPCNKETAVNAIKLEPQNSPMSCVMEGTTKSSTLAFAPKEGEKLYISIKCEKVQ